MENVIENLVPFGFFTMVILVVYFTAKFRYELKKEILAKGGSLDVSKKTFPFLESALTVVGVGLGLGLSLLIRQASNLQEASNNLMVCSFALFFGGLGMVSGYLLKRRFETSK